MAYDKEFLVDVPMVTRMESTRAAQNFRVTPLVLMADFGYERQKIYVYIARVLDLQSLPSNMALFGRDNY